LGFGGTGFACRARIQKFLTWGKVITRLDPGISGKVSEWARTAPKMIK
jgi:hypothetical protein